MGGLFSKLWAMWGDERKLSLNQNLLSLTAPFCDNKGSKEDRNISLLFVGTFPATESFRQRCHSVCPPHVLLSRYKVAGILSLPSPGVSFSLSPTHAQKKQRPMICILLQCLTAPLHPMLPVPHDWGAEHRLIIVGLDNAGKTTIFYQL